MSASDYGLWWGCHMKLQPLITNAQTLAPNDVTSITRIFWLQFWDRVRTLVYFLLPHSACLQLSTRCPPHCPTARLSATATNSPQTDRGQTCRLETDEEDTLPDRTDPGRKNPPVHAQRERAQEVEMLACIMGKKEDWVFSLSVVCWLAQTTSIMHPVIPHLPTKCGCPSSVTWPSSVVQPINTHNAPNQETSRSILSPIQILFIKWSGFNGYW